MCLIYYFIVWLLSTFLVFLAIFGSMLQTVRFHAHANFDVVKINMHPLRTPRAHMHARRAKRRLQCSTHFDASLTWITRPDGADEYVLPHTLTCSRALTLAHTLNLTRNVKDMYVRPSRAH